MSLTVSFKFVRVSHNSQIDNTRAKCYCHRLPPGPRPIHPVTQIVCTWRSCVHLHLSLFMSLVSETHTLTSLVLCPRSCAQSRSSVHLATEYSMPRTTASWSVDFKYCEVYRPASSNTTSIGLSSYWKKLWWPNCSTVYQRVFPCLKRQQLSPIPWCYKRQHWYTAVFGVMLEI